MARGLFDESDSADRSAQPLAARMRPRNLDELVGQQQIVGPGTALRTAIENDDITSMIFWGPAGCGKSTLAAVIAEHTACSFENFSAVISGVPEMRKVIQRAKELRQVSGRRTILFVDEIHRFNKANRMPFCHTWRMGRLFSSALQLKTPILRLTRLCFPARDFLNSSRF